MSSIIFLLHERHLYVDLRELWCVNAGLRHGSSEQSGSSGRIADHKKLFEHLGRLRQSIELLDVPGSER